MFTGIVEGLAVVQGRDGNRFSFQADMVDDGVKVGDSIAVNGCCLTVIEVGEGWWASDVVQETLRRTNLGDLEIGDAVNLERSLRFEGRLDGHIVQGHVDAVGSITDPAPDMRIVAPPSLLRYVVEKGSIAVDGCSLTVANVDPEGFGVAIVPHTARVTTLGRKGPGKGVNLEVDIIAKYVERLMRPAGVIPPNEGPETTDQDTTRE